MSKEMVLFSKEELTFKYKFYNLMNLLINNQSTSRLETLLMISIFNIQIISSFYDKQLKIFNGDISFVDSILNDIKHLFRIKDLMRNSYINYLILQTAIFILIIICLFHFLIICVNVTRKSIYSLNEKLINLYIKLFIYILYNIIYDLSFCSFCISSDEKNPHFMDVSCSINDHIFMFIISIILIIINFLLYFYIQIYYSDSFYLNNSFYAKMSCNYDLFMGLNALIHSFFLNQSKYLSKEIFLVYNTITSILLFIFYYTHLLYYDNITNTLVGICHMLYAWTSIFSLIMNFMDFQEKGIMYIISSILVVYLYINLQNKLENTIFFDIPFYEIKNPFYLLYYFHKLIDKVSKIDEDPTSKSFLTGIVEMHKIECPNPLCVSKTKDSLYLPLNKKWSDRSKSFVQDEVFLKSLLIVIMNYFITANSSNPDMYLNLSLYYLTVIGNYCQSIYYYRKITELKLSSKEEFSLIRLNIKISNTLVEALKSPNEQCVSLENLNVSMYYKYDDLSQNFVDEISNDVNLSLEFWKTFRASLRDPTKKVDFNKIFQLTDKIRITKKNVEIMWNELLNIYGGVNAYFKLYSEYVEQINDDDLKKRDLESLKRKNDNFSDHIGQNFYSVLFNKETVVLIANGDKGNEGVIELSNKEIENIFKYRPMDIKGMNLTSLMPKLFSKNHSKYIEKYFKIGEKKIIDKNDFKTYGKDKNNSIIKIKLAVKLFPILNENIFFVGLIVKENIDDIILMDENFNIQGMSSKLMKILNIENKFIFQENEIPFYTICRKFINFYSIFLNTKKTNDISYLDETIEEGNLDNEKIKKHKENKNDNKEDGIGENIQINENVELEYEIKLPQFLIDYSEKTNRKDNKLGFKASSMNSDINDHNNEDEVEIEEQYDENDLLIDKGSEDKEETHDSMRESNIKSRYSPKLQSRLRSSLPPPLNKNIIDTPTPSSGTPTQTPTPTPTPTNGGPRPSSNMKEHIKNNLKENYNKQSEEEKIYRQKIKHYKSLFNSGKFSELEDLIDLNNKDSSSIEFKFNFTFDRMKYGDKQVAYIVRCIDNKNDLGRSEEESIEDFDPKAAKYKKDKSEAIKPLYELYAQEKKDIIEMQDKFLKLSTENKKFQKLLQACKNDIVNMSKAHGHNKDEILEDENSSQSSQAGFDSGLVKKNRIEEIRSNLLLNISNFYTLKYLRLASILLGVGTITFIIVYISFFSSINKSLKNVSEININLFQTTLWTTELVSIFISLRTLFKEKMNPREDFRFNNYVFENVQDVKSYYNEMELQAYYLYNNLSNAYGYLEMNISNYLSEKNLMELYWDNIAVSYYINLTKINNESFPMSISQILSSCYSYLFDSHYFLNLTEDDINKYNLKNDEYFDYTTHLIIENAYDYILPNQFEKLLTLPKKLSQYNSDKKKPILIMIFVYTAFMILICASFFLLIHLTNKSMTDGLEKVTKIRLEKIEETIKKIETFNVNLKKFRDKDSKATQEKEDSEMSDDQKNKNQQGDVKSNVSVDKRKRNQDSSSIIGSNGFNTDVKKYIPLNVLNSSFFHGIILFMILCGFLVPTYIYSNEMITNSNQLLLVENYIFGKLITASSKTVEIKCFMSECQNKTYLEYNNLVNMDLIQEVIKGINLFSNVNKFYNKKYLLDACAACMEAEENYEYYLNCTNETLIISANNTDNLIKLIEDLVENIYKEYEMEVNTEGFYKEKLYSTSYFQQMEEIFYLYIIQVGDLFAKTVYNDFNSFLRNKKTLITILVICLGIIMFIYCLYLGIFFVRTLVHYLSVSRCIMKIIPTSVIISTQELETWIENKY